MKQMKRKMMLVGMMLTAFAASAQTFVSTQPGKRNALIEEYTGVNCQYCPLGHKATDRVSVASSDGRPFTLALLDVAGRVLLQSNGSSLDLGAVAQGVYYLRIVSDGNVHVRKLIKQ